MKVAGNRGCGEDLENILAGWTHPLLFILQIYRRVLTVTRDSTEFLTADSIPPLCQHRSSPRPPVCLLLICHCVFERVRQGGGDSDDMFSPFLLPSLLSFKKCNCARYRFDCIIEVPEATLSPNIPTPPLQRHLIPIQSTGGSEHGDDSEHHEC